MPITGAEVLSAPTQWFVKVGLSATTYEVPSDQHDERDSLTSPPPSGGAIMMVTSSVSLDDHIVAGDAV